MSATPAYEISIRTQTKVYATSANYEQRHPSSSRHSIRAASDFQQEFKNLDVPLRFGDVLAPGVQPVPAKQKPVGAWMWLGFFK